MKAITRPRYGSPEVLQCVDLATPTPSDGEVLVQVCAASVGAWDWHYLTADPHLMRLSTGLRRPKNPLAGVDLAGRVEAVGSSVDGFEIGDEVFGVADGAFAEFACTTEDQLALKPTNLTFEEAAAVPTAATTALIGLSDLGDVQPGQRVLIIGASGGVGTFAVQIATSLGAEVTAVCATESVELMRSLGSEHIIDYTRQPVLDLDDSFDLIFQLAGRDPALKLRSLLTARGTLVLSSGEGGRWIGPAARLIVAVTLSPFVSQRLCTFVADPRRPHLEKLRELIEAGKVTPVIDRVYPLEEAATAIEHIRIGRSRGKTVLTI